MMASRRHKTMIGVAMVALGLVQTAIYVGQNEWVPTALGLGYAGIGVAYLWAEVVREAETTGDP